MVEGFGIHQSNVYDRIRKNSMLQQAKQHERLCNEFQMTFRRIRVLDLRHIEEQRMIVFFVNFSLNTKTF